MLNCNVQYGVQLCIGVLCCKMGDMALHSALDACLETKKKLTSRGTLHCGSVGGIASLCDVFY